MGHLSLLCINPGAQPYRGYSPTVLLAAIDEAMGDDPKGIFYVVAAAVVIAEPQEARDALRDVIDGPAGSGVSTGRKKDQI